MPEAGFHYLTAAVQLEDNDSYYGLVSAPFVLQYVPPTCGPLPTGWTSAYIGTAGNSTGDACYNSGSQTFEVKGSGADIWNTSDQFRFVYQSLDCNGEIIARVNSLENTHIWAKSGIMIRESAAADAKHAMIVVTPSNGVSFQYRSTTGGSMAQQSTPGVAPKWLRLVRSGNIFSAFHSDDPTTKGWTSWGTIQISMSENVLIGLALTSHNNSVVNTSIFSHVTITKNCETPIPPSTDIWVETECAQLGSAWTKLNNINASRGEAITAPNGVGNNWGASENTEHHATVTFNAAQAGNYYMFVRANAPTGSDDSFWFKLNSGAWNAWISGIRVSNNYEWNLFATTVSLQQGANTLKIGFREDGIILDKIYFAPISTPPAGLGGTAPACNTNPNPNPTPVTTAWLEAECALYGSSWTQIEETSASEDKALASPNGSGDNYSPSESVNEQIRFNFEVSQAGTYYLYARIKAPSSSDDSYWVRVNEGVWTAWNSGISIHPTNYNWNRFGTALQLNAGINTVTFSRREDGAVLDKIYISMQDQRPVNEGNVATNCETSPEPLPTGTTFKLINAGTDQVYNEAISNNALINLNGMTEFNMMVTNLPSGSARVNFTILGGPLAGHTQSEGAAPFAIFGDLGADYYGRPAQAGNTHTIKVDILDANGAVLQSTTIAFSFTNSGGMTLSAPSGEIGSFSAQKTAPAVVHIVNMYPNALQTNRLQVDLSEKVSGNVIYLITDELGRVVFQAKKNLSSAQDALDLEMDVQSLKPGIYYLRIQGDSFVGEVKRLIKE
ncbi:MAG: T9SS type A sorting domain-containing protein [Bacteroidia bacterium]|nr:T9SS type A sorting domain-containing protein [Bacteroidia bacterium]